MQHGRGGASPCPPRWEWLDTVASAKLFVLTQILMLEINVFQLSDPIRVERWELFIVWGGREAGSRGTLGGRRGGGQSSGTRRSVPFPPSPKGHRCAVLTRLMKLQLCLQRTASVF